MAALASTNGTSEDGVGAVMLETCRRPSIPLTEDFKIWGYCRCFVENGRHKYIQSKKAGLNGSNGKSLLEVQGNGVYTSGRGPRRKLKKTE